MMSPVARLLSVTAAIAATASRLQAIVLFDGISDVTAVTVTGSTPRTFMGEAVTLDAGGFSAAMNSISSIEVAAANVTGAEINGPLRLNLWVWQSYDPAAVAPAGVFGDQVGILGTPTSVSDFGVVSMPNGTFVNGTVNFNIPVVITPISGTTIGITVNWQVDQGAGFVSLPGLTSILHTGVPPSIGTNATGAAPNFGYYRNVSGESDGNFLNTSQRSVGADSGLLLRINGPDPVPEPAPALLGAVFGVTLLARRTRQA